MKTQLPQLLALILLTSLACTNDGDTTDADVGETGTGTGDGDGDGDATGDGDGDGDATGDGDGDGDATGDGDGEPVLSDITVNVTYAGMQTGTLSIAALLSFPPDGPPLAAASDDMSVFPWSGTLNDLENNDYYIVAVLDVGNNNPMSPGPEDLVAFTPMPITIDGADAIVDLELMDP